MCVEKGQNSQGAQRVRSNTLKREGMSLSDEQLPQHRRSKICMPLRLPSNLQATYKHVRKTMRNGGHLDSGPGFGILRNQSSVVSASKVLWNHPGCGLGAWVLGGGFDLAKLEPWKSSRREEVCTTAFPQILWGAIRLPQPTPMHVADRSRANVLQHLGQDVATGAAHLHKPFPNSQLSAIAHLRVWLLFCCDEDLSRPSDWGHCMQFNRMLARLATGEKARLCAGQTNKGFQLDFDCTPTRPALSFV